MPGKSKHGKGRRPQNKARVKQQPAQTASTAAASPSVAAPVAIKPAAAVKPSTRLKTTAYTPATSAEYPHFISELKNITIITAVIVVILVVLALIIK